MSEGRCGHSPGMTQKEASRLRNKLGVQEERLKFGFEGHTIWLPTVGGMGQKLRRGLAPASRYRHEEVWLAV